MTSAAMFTLRRLTRPTSSDCYTCRPAAPCLHMFTSFLWFSLNLAAPEAKQVNRSDNQCFHSLGGVYLVLSTRFKCDCVKRVTKCSSPCPDVLKWCLDYFTTKKQELNWSERAQSSDDFSFRGVRICCFSVPLKVWMNFHEPSVWK